MTTQSVDTTARRVLSKVPEVTIYFWIIKILCTTVGESAADFLNVNLNLGLTGTSVVTGALLAIALVVQFKADGYVPSRYWTTVALVSVFGTLVTDNLTDKVGLPLTTSTTMFAILLTITFIGWYASEKTLSIHSIFTPRREAFYWLAILWTFALGTAVGDLVAEELGVGYLATLFLVAGLIGATAIAWKLGLNSILSFWIAYILTRPLGASIGDYMSQPGKYGGLGLGATVTTAIFTAGILALVIYLSVTKTDAISMAAADDTTSDPPERGALLQTIIVVTLLLVVGGTAYHLRKDALASDNGDVATAADGPGSGTSPLGDLTNFRTITQDTIDYVNAGDQGGASTRVDDLEHEWDTSEARLKPRDKTTWTEIDGKVDAVLRQVRAVNPDAQGEKAALAALLTSLN